MKKLILLIFASLVIFSCNTNNNDFRIDFQLWGAEKEVHSLYFWDGIGDPIISGTVKGNYQIELTTDSDISGRFHLGKEKAGRFYEDDIVMKSFKLKKGETFTSSGDFSFYGEIFDHAFILVDICTSEGYNPARIVSSSVVLTNSK